MSETKEYRTADGDTVTTTVEPERHWRTASGMLVREVDRKVDERGALKILCRRTERFGSHGWLHASKLRDPSKEHR